MARKHRDTRSRRLLGAPGVWWWGGTCARTRPGSPATAVDGGHPRRGLRTWSTPGSASTPMAYFAIGTEDVRRRAERDRQPQHRRVQRHEAVLARARGRSRPCERHRSTSSSMCGEADYPAAGSRSAGGASRRTRPARGLRRSTWRASPSSRGPMKVALDAANGMAVPTRCRALLEAPARGARRRRSSWSSTGPSRTTRPIPLKEENLDPVRALVQGLSGAALRRRASTATRTAAASSTRPGVTVRGRPDDRAPGARVHPGARAGRTDRLRPALVLGREGGRSEKAGGVPIRDRVGHSFIKATMRDRRCAVFGGRAVGPLLLQATTSPATRASHRLRSQRARACVSRSSERAQLA